MSFFPDPSIVPTPGTAYEAFVPGTYNPMIPQALYRPAAAGPRYLTGLGAHQYMSQLRRPILPQLRGLGGAVEDILSGGLDVAIRQAIIASWPTIQAQMDPMIKPMQVALGVTAVASLTAAVLAYLSWRRY